MDNDVYIYIYFALHVLLPLIMSFMLQNVGGGQQDDCDYTHQSPSEPSQIVQLCEDRGENVAAIPHRPVGNITTLHDPEVYNLGYLHFLY